MKPEVSYQGSALLGTVVRPWAREEFDIDLLCILSTNRLQYPEPMAIYNLVADRLAERAVYRKIMKRKERCIELNYAGQFHLDIVACPICIANVHDIESEQEDAPPADWERIYQSSIGFLKKSDQA